MSKTMYSADFSYDEVSLVKITVTKETEHTISVSDKEMIIDGGYQWFGSKRVYKDKFNLFDTLDEAIKYLIERLEAANKNNRQKIRDNEIAIDELKALRI